MPGGHATRVPVTGALDGRPAITVRAKTNAVSRHGERRSGYGTAGKGGIDAPWRNLRGISHDTSLAPAARRGGPKQPRHARHDVTARRQRFTCRGRTSPANGGL